MDWDEEDIKERARKQAEEMEKKRVMFEESLRDTSIKNIRAIFKESLKGICIQSLEESMAHLDKIDLLPDMTREDMVVSIAKLLGMATEYKIPHDKNLVQIADMKMSLETLHKFYNLQHKIREEIFKQIQELSRIRIKTITTLKGKIERGEIKLNVNYDNIK